MADVYKFKIRLCELENVIWREIEITSVSSVAKLSLDIRSRKVSKFEVVEVM